MSSQLGTCGCTDIPKTTTPGNALDASDITVKRADQTTYTFFGSSKTTFESFAEKYAWMKGRATCTDSSLCLKTTS
jgi:hypothetical protein